MSLNDHEGQVSSENCYMGEKKNYPHDLSHYTGELCYRHLTFSLIIIGVLKKKKSGAQSVPGAMTKAEKTVQMRPKVGKLEEAEEDAWEGAPLP